MCTAGYCLSVVLFDSILSDLVHFEIRLCLMSAFRHTSTSNRDRWKVILIGSSCVSGIKKGIVEVADMIVVNKSDGDLVTAAKVIEAEYRSATRFIQTKNPFWHTKVNILVFQV